MDEEGVGLWKVITGSAGGVFVAASTTLIRMRERVSNLELRTKANEDELNDVTTKIDETHDTVIRLETNVAALEEDVREGAKFQRKTNQEMLEKLTSIEIIVRSNGGR